MMIQIVLGLREGEGSCAPSTPTTTLSIKLTGIYIILNQDVRFGKQEVISGEEKLKFASHGMCVSVIEYVNLV